MKKSLKRLLSLALVLAMLLAFAVPVMAAPTQTGTLTCKINVICDPNAQFTYTYELTEDQYNTLSTPLEVLKAKGVTGYDSYTFTGWYSDSGCTQAVTYPLVSNTNPTVYAACFDKTQLNAELEETSYEYTGSAINVKPVVKYGTATLIEGTDYDLTYYKNVNASTTDPTVGVNFKGIFTGATKKTIHFTITKAAAKDPTAADFTVTLAALDLTEDGTDQSDAARDAVTPKDTTMSYTLKFYEYGKTTELTECKEAGTYTVKAFVTADDNWNANKTGINLGQFTIKAAAPAAACGTLNCTIEVLGGTTVTYTNDKVEAGKKADIVQPEEMTAYGVPTGYTSAGWFLDKNYTEPYTNKTYVDIAEGATLNLYAKCYDASAKATVTLDSAVNDYTGTAIEPKVTVKLGDEVLKSGYTVAYSDNNVNANSNTIKAYDPATVTVTFTGAYQNLAPLTEKFYITPIKPKAANFVYTAPTSLVADGTAKEATVDTAKGVKGMGKVTVKYFDASGKQLASAPTDAGTYTVKVSTAAGRNYTATESDIEVGTFTLTPDTYGTLTCHIDVIGVGDTATTYTYDLKQESYKDGDIGSPLTVLHEHNNKTYDSYTFTGWYTNEACTIPVTYPLTASENPVLYAKCYDSKNFTAAFKDTDNTKHEYTYTGEEIKPEIAVKYKVGDKYYDLASDGSEYEITWPEDVTNAGEKKVTITFKGIYEGVTAQYLTYTITPATLKVTINPLKAVQSVAYGSALPTLTYADLSYDTLLGKDKEKALDDIFTGTITSTSKTYKPGCDAGKSYTVEVSVANLKAANYTITAASSITYKLNVTKKTLYLYYTNLSMNSVSCQLYSKATWNASTKHYTVSKNDLTTVFGNDHVSYGIYNKSTKKVIHGFLTYKNGSYSGTFTLTSRGSYLFALELNPNNYNVIKINDMTSSSYSNTSSKGNTSVKR